MKFGLRMCALGLVALFSVATVASAQEVKLDGGGSTFTNPICQRWAAEYNKLHPNVKINYSSIGSGGGIKGITDKTFDFAGTDAPLDKKELAKAGGADNLIEFPTVAGGVVMAYNLPDVKGELRLDGPTIADIYLGKIKTWNDPKIAAMNPGVNLPNLPVQPVHRTDGSGTTYIFTKYLSGESTDFSDKVGSGKQVEFPGGLGGKGNEGVTQAVQSTKGGLGYVESAYADQNKLAVALIKNKAGNFVAADTQSVALAGDAALADMKVPNLLAADLWDKTGEKVYPIASFTYIVIYKDLSYMKNPAKEQALVDFLKWCTTDGQKMAAELDYAPLTEAVQKKVQTALDMAKK